LEEIIKEGKEEEYLRRVFALEIIKKTILD